MLFPWPHSSDWSVAHEPGKAQPQRPALQATHDDTACMTRPPTTSSQHQLSSNGPAALRCGLEISKRFCGPAGPSLFLPSLRCAPSTGGRAALALLRHRESTGSRERRNQTRSAGPDIQRCGARSEMTTKTRRSSGRSDQTGHWPRQQASPVPGGRAKPGGAGRAVLCCAAEDESRVA